MSHILHKTDFEVIRRPLAMPLIGEGVAMALCLVPAIHYGDGMILPLLLAAIATLVVGFLLQGRRRRNKNANPIPDKRVSYILVCLIWILLSLFGTLPFLFTGSCTSFSDAFFESMSGLTSTGATIFPDVSHMPPSLLLWRSISQWFGGFGIILLVLAIVPRLGLNRYSLYTAEVSVADNVGKTSFTLRSRVQHTLAIYISLTLFFVVALYFSGMSLWEAVNITFTNISTGGFSIYSDSIAGFTPLQQYILAAAMFFGGVNFALLYNLFTFRWSQMHHKLDQLGFYMIILTISAAFVVAVLYMHDGYAWKDALRCGVVQTVSVVTTTGSVVADTNSWWTPVVLLFLALCFCGGMAGSTTGGVKVMRLLVLLRGVKQTIFMRIHPNAYNPVRLNGQPVQNDLVTNVMVIFIVFAITILVTVLLLMVCGVGAEESLGAAFGCITGYGPGLGSCGGFGSYSAFPPVAKCLCSLLMLLGRLECLTVFILFMPGFWRR